MKKEFPLTFIQTLAVFLFKWLSFILCKPKNTADAISGDAASKSICRSR